MATGDIPRTPGGSPAPAPVEEGHGVGAPPGVSAQDVAGLPPSGTRMAHTWIALSAGLLFLIVVLVFILENLHSVRVHFFGATWTVPLAVDLLLAAVLGGLIMFAVGSLRILQLRRAASQAGRRPPSP